MQNIKAWFPIWWKIISPNFNLLRKQNNDSEHISGTENSSKLRHQELNDEGRTTRTTKSINLSNNLELNKVALSSI